MAWEWSHSPEAYAAARFNLYQLERDELNTIYAEWKARQSDLNDSDPEWLTVHDHAERYAATLGRDQVAGYIWDAMEDQRTCTNGGFDAWACPYGCGCHLVSFDADPEEVAAFIE